MKGETNERETSQGTIAVIQVEVGGHALKQGNGDGEGKMDLRAMSMALVNTVTDGERVVKDECHTFCFHDCVERCLAKESLCFIQYTL